MNFVPINPQGSKAERLARHRKAIAGGAISLQVKQPWIDVYIRELVGFPKHGSDQVDATTQLLDWEPKTPGSLRRALCMPVRLALTLRPFGTACFLFGNSRYRPRHK